MSAKWKCRVLLYGGSEFFVRRKNGSMFLEGNGSEAMKFAARVRAHYLDREVKRVEVRSEGPVADLDELDPGRFLFTVRPHPNGRDWWVDESWITHPCWVLQLDHAIDHCMFRGRGHVCEIRVVDANDELQSVVLADTRGDCQFADSALQKTLCDLVMTRPAGSARSAV